jgi:hypothetical protein
MRAVCRLRDSSGLKSEGVRGFTERQTAALIANVPHTYIHAVGAGCASFAKECVIPEIEQEFWHDPPPGVSRRRRWLARPGC